MIGITPQPASLVDLSAGEKALLLGSADCDVLKTNIDTVRLAHGDPTPRPNAEYVDDPVPGNITVPTDAEGFKKWPRDWQLFWLENVAVLTTILTTPPV